MTDTAEVVIMADWKVAKAEYDRRRTERHKRRLQKAEDEAIGLPAFPGGIDDMELGE